MRKGVRGLVACLMAASLITAGCGADDSGGSDEQTAISFAWWGVDGRNALTNEALDLFERKNPNIKVERDYGGFDGYTDRIVSKFAARTPPDVVQLYADVQSEFGERDQLLDLDPYVPETVNLEGWSKELIDAGRGERGLTSLNFGLTTHSTVLNEDLFKKYGVPLPPENWTWADLKEASEAISKASKGKVYGVMDGSASSNPFEIWARQRGQEYLDANGLGFQEQTLVDYWDYWSSVREANGATPADVTAEHQDPRALLSAGKIAIGFVFANQYASYVKDTPAKLVLRRMPGESEREIGGYLRSAMTLSVAKSSAHPKEAASLVNFLMNDPEAAAILGIDRGVPPNANMVPPATKGLDQTNLEAVALIEQLRKEGVTPPAVPPPGSAEALASFVEVGLEVAFGKLSSQAAAAEYVKKAGERFAK